MTTTAHTGRWTEAGAYHCTCGTIFGRNPRGMTPFAVAHEHALQHAAEVNPLDRVRVLLGSAAHARFSTELSDVPIGSIARQVRTPYASGSIHPVWDWYGVPVIIAETRHRRYEVFRVSGPIGPVD